MAEAKKGKIKSQGTDLFVCPDTSTSTVDKLACITQISGLGGARNQIDTTCFSSQEGEFEGGIAKPGQITIGGIYDENDEVFITLVSLKDSADVVPWWIGGSNGTEAPTITAGALTPPATRTGIQFNGYVADITWQMDPDNVWRYQLVIQRSGPWHLTKKTP